MVGAFLYKSITKWGIITKKGYQTKSIYEHKKRNQPPHGIWFHFLR